MLFFGVTIVGVALDLWTKKVAFEHLSDGVYKVPDPSLPDGRFEANPTGEYQFIPGWLHFRVVTNQGAVFGLGRGQRWLFVVVSIAAIAVLTSLFAKSDDRHFYQLLLGLLLAGVLGNMYDRIHLGYVRDMIYALPEWKNPLSRFEIFKEWKTVFPWIFNVADSLLCVGVFFMIVYSFVHKPQRESKPDSTAPPKPRDIPEPHLFPAGRLSPFLSITSALRSW